MENHWYVSLVIEKVAGGLLFKGFLFQLTLVGAISQIVPLGSLTQVFVFKLQQVTPAQSIDWYSVINMSLSHIDICSHVDATHRHRWCK